MFSVSEKVLISDNFRDLIILPNPFHDKISINAAFTNDEVLTFQLFNVNGSIILDDKKQNAIKTGIHSFQINNLDKLSNGIYFLHLIVSEQSYLIKLQKE
ncbi:MAG: T9SS type A sorting domain-containing protein [Bacteroidetes bacterium]|nr:T9SS type A sorting domain-containing protein [Bacteroidota bacterium]